MEIVGLIPARGGSKGIPGKNLALVAGRPLIEWTCAAATASATLTRCIVSTDDPKIAEIARAAGIDVPFMRPDEIAQDATPMIDVVRHALEELGGPDAIVLLQPTSPLRTHEHIDLAVRLWQTEHADSVVSVVEVPHAFTPSSLMRLTDGRLKPAHSDLEPTRRQDKEPLVARNGPAVVVTSREVIRQGSLYGANCRALEMPRAASVDIDTTYDLELADYLLRRRIDG